MSHPPHVEHPERRPRTRPSDCGTPPPDLADPLLWALAVDVAAAHRPGPDGACTNLQCRGQRGACWALRAAHRAAHLARRATGRSPHAVPQPVAPQPPAAQPVAALPRRTGCARGHASIPTAGQRFTGWFRPTAALAPPVPPVPPVPEEPTPHRSISFRRPPVAALAA